MNVVIVHIYILMTMMLILHDSFVGDLGQLMGHNPRTNLQFIIFEAFQVSRMT